jgi:hypothetical protein
MTKARLARKVVAAKVLNRMMMKRQLANLILKNTMKQSKSGNHHRDELNWEKHCRSTFPTPAAFVKFYKLTPKAFDSLRDKISRFIARRRVCITLR